MNDIISNFNTITNKLYSSIKTEGYQMLDEISNIDTSIFEKEPLKTLYSKDNIDNLMLIISCFIIAIIIYYAIKCLINLYSDTSIENIYFFIIKIIVISILSLNSFTICKKIININYLFCDTISCFLEEISGKKLDYEFLDENISNLEEFFKSVDKVSINGIKDSIICTYIISLIIFFSIRYVTILLCIIFSPIAFFSLILSSKKFLFYTWEKIFLVNLIIQGVNKIIIFIPVVSKSEKEIYSSILIGSAFIMFKLNKLVGDIKFYGQNK